MIHQVCAEVIENPLQDGGRDKSESDDVPCIVQVRGNEALKVDRLSGLRNGKQNDVLGTGCGIQHAIENRLQQHQAEGFQETDAGQEKHPGQQLHEEREYIADKPHQLPHRAPERSRPQSLAAGEIGVTCKALFYLSGKRTCDLSVPETLTTEVTEDHRETTVLAVTVYDFNAISGTAKVLADFFCDHDRTVLASSATERDRQVALA